MVFVDETWTEANRAASVNGHRCGKRLPGNAVAALEHLDTVLGRDGDLGSLFHFVKRNTIR